MGQKCQIITVVFKFQSRGDTPSILRQQLPTLGFYLISLLTHELSNLLLVSFRWFELSLFVFSHEINIVSFQRTYY